MFVAFQQRVYLVLAGYKLVLQVILVVRQCLYLALLLLFLNEEVVCLLPGQLKLVFVLMHNRVQLVFPLLGYLLYFSLEMLFDLHLPHLPRLLPQCFQLQHGPILLFSYTVTFLAC